jgi:hypothetical protein
MSNEKFNPINVGKLKVTLPNRYKEMFCNMESLKSYMMKQILQEARGIIQSKINEDFKDIDYYS